ncbi:hypothetical protein EC957_000381, partial [Mortierella hygrophila]
DPPRKEILKYRDMRSLSAHESMWRILEYPLHGHSPAVQRLQVHPIGQHNVTFNNCADLLCVAC